MTFFFLLSSFANLMHKRYGETLRRSPEEDKLLWHGLQPLIDAGRIVPVVYDTIYHGLECVPRALNDLNTRKVWGKAVITVDDKAKTGLDARL